MTGFSCFTTCTSSLINGGDLLDDNDDGRFITSVDDDNGEVFAEFEMGLFKLFLISSNLSLDEQDNGTGSFSFARTCPEKNFI